MKVIVMGCGRLGRQVSRLLDGQGHEVTVIDEDEKSLENLRTEFRGKMVKGVGFDREVLIKAGIETADAFVATSYSDNANIVAARVAHNIFHVPRVMASLYDPRRAEIYRRLGLVTISMIAWASQQISEIMSHINLEPAKYFGKGEVSLIPCEIPFHVVGRTVSQVTIPGEISVVTITRQDEALIPTLGTEFCDGDLVYFAVQASAMDRLEALLGL
jgi:trk system potassium uptake protein